MSLKQFNADVRSARSRIEDGDISGVFAIERGDSDGEVVVTVAHEKIPSLLPIRILAQGLDRYPSDHTFLVFTTSEDAPSSVVSALENLRDYTSGMRLVEAITTLSACVDRCLRLTDANQDTAVEDQEDEHISDDSMEDYFTDDFSDHEFGLAPMHTIIQDRPHSRLASGTLRRIKLDLCNAREAGCRVGVLDGLQLSSTCHTFSLSIRASELGLSQEALEAWHVNIADYIILLVRIEGSYPSAEQLLEQPCVNFNVDFRFGKGIKYKPSPAQARAAFLTETSRKHGASEVKAQSLEDDRGRTFEKTFISSSLEQLMNEKCLRMIKLRLQNPASSWDDANEHHRIISTGATLADDIIGKASTDEEGSRSEPKSKKKTRSTGKSKGKQTEMTADSASEADAGTRSPKPIPNFLMRDATATRPLGQCSVPLIIMQFAVHYFSRCTEYCLRCHQRVGTEFEALKPFVCSNPLCLFQYLAMGFGPSIEHEILTQPYVVDLLVSLCYSSIQVNRQAYWRPLEVAPPSYGIREFPCGLHLKVPASNTASSATIASGNAASASDIMATKKKPSAASEVAIAHTAIKVMADLQNGVVTIPSGDLDSISSDTWIMLREHSKSPHTEPAYHHGRVRYVDRQTGALEVEFSFLEPLGAAGVVEMDMLEYDTEFDDLDDHGKAASMTTILNTLPPILSLRKYLIKNPHRRLRSYSGISPAAVTLLEWIVASNRSYILQVTPVEDTDPTLLDQIKTREQEAIPSLKNSVQFRFAQGAPDKESRFHRALKETKLQNSEYPTLFAWHGSALSNWHSILRYGLDFKDVINGRAYGNGVYFSQNYQTSQGYAAAGAASPWPRSALNIFSVISLCEIVNAPSRFVSTHPHLVVGQVDWIQCRYLFAQRSPVYDTTTGHAVTYSAAVASPAVSSGPATGIPKEQVVAQDPARTVLGPDNKPLCIPLKAVPTRKQQTPQAPSSSKRGHGPMSSSEETDEEETSDIEFFLEGDVPSPPPAKRPNSARESSVDTATAREVTTQRPLTPPQTDFRPGMLDLGTLPRLPLPGWATSHSTKRLTEQILHMQKVQALTPPHELGWYIDFENMENMFQWIVEFHSFDPELPLAKDMKKAGVTSIVLEVRFGRDYPFSPPFVRVVRPRFLPFALGGGGHITIGGAICMELLTSSGWLPTISMDIVFVSIRTAMTEPERPARLQTTDASANMFDYGPGEALDAYIRFAGAHGWAIPKDLQETATQRDGGTF